MLPNTVAAGAKFGSHVLSVSEDSLKLAFIGPSEYTVTVANARSLDEVRLISFFSVSYHVVSEWEGWGENIWLSVMVHRRSTARSKHCDQEPDFPLYSELT